MFIQLEKPIEFESEKVNVFKSIDKNLNNLKKSNPFKLKRNQTFYNWLEKINL